jgi:signal transduction histidine kinase
VTARSSRAPGLDLGLVLAPTAGPDIADAAARVAGRLPADLQLRDEEITRHMSWIACACIGEQPQQPENGATLTLRRRLIELIRGEVIRAWGADGASPDSATMLGTLERLERAQQACVPSVEQAFTAELADRGGLDLVVEVAHDMRSPLTSILFLSEILHRDPGGALSDVHKRQVGIIYSAALGLVGMASDMIEMAKGGNRLTDLEAVPFSVNEVLRGVHDLVKPTAEEKRLDLRISGLMAEHRIGHPVPLSRVLLNLTTNALKFTHAGSVELGARTIEGSRIEFSVRDTGPGISDDAVELLYQPFRREARRASGFSFSGTGLGLAICRRLVHALGSELKLESAPKWGTRFYFELDLPPASAL